MHIVFLEGSRIIFCYERRDMACSDEDLTVGGLTLVRGEPFDTWKIVYDGSGSDLPDGRVLVTPRKDRPAGWDRRSPVQMEIEFRRMADPYYFRRGDSGHFEQIGSASGWITVDGARREFSGFGLRDKSWGARPWTDSSQGVKKETNRLGTGAAEGLFNMWITSVVGKDLAFAMTATRDPHGGLHSSGFLYRDGAYHPVTKLEVESEFEEGTVFHTANRFRAEFEGGHRLSGRGTTLSLGPSKVAQPGGATLVNSGMTRFELDTGDIGLGSSEYWFAVQRGRTD
jgi:hypothetical protein